MKVKHKNLKEDFKLLLSLGSNYGGEDFTIVFRSSKVDGKTYTCSKAGTTYTNCEMADDTHVLCLLDNTGLNCGLLAASITVCLEDSQMPDGSYKVADTRLVEALDEDGTSYHIELTNGASDPIQTSEMVWDLLGTVLKGKDGEGCSEEEKAEIIAEAVAEAEDALQPSIDDLNDAVFPLSASISSSNAGTYEAGTSVTPSITLSITKKGTDVASDATISVTPTATVSDDHKTITASAITTNTTYSIDVVKGSEKKTLKASYAWTNYRYYGVLDSAPASADEIVSLIEACNEGAEGNTLTKELSTTSTLGSTPLASGKYYLFAVKGTPTLVCHHAETGGTISATTGTIDEVPQANDSSKTNKYSYIIVPASTSAWNFTIKNS